jgi:hypothetical protein
MLSEKLASLAAHFRGYTALGGVYLSPSMCTLFAVNLEADMLLAQTLEGRTASVVRFDGTQPSNVVPIDRARIRATFQPPVGRDGAA